MRDRDGREHPDDEPVTWCGLVGFLDRELAHRDRLSTEKERGLREARELRERQMLLSHRIVIALIMVLGIAVQWLLRK